MHIAIDVTPLESDHSGRGIGVYTKLLIKSLQSHEHKHTYHLFTRGQKIPDTIDLVHYPYFDPFFLTLPLYNSKPRVVTVHDLIPMKFPHYFPKGIRGTFKWLIQKQALKNSQAIITDSSSPANDIHRFTGINQKRINVIYLGVDINFKKIEDFKSLDSVKRKLNLPEKFILSVGDLNYNKNSESILKAFSQVRKEMPNYNLVLVGKGFIDSSLQKDAFDKLMKDLELEKHVKRISAIDKNDLVRVYNLASVYVQPSLSEGFGLPVLEAMACETPVVSSSRDSLREVVGDAAHIIDPYNINSIASGILKLIQDKDYRRIMIKKGMDRVKLFSWNKCAQETAKIYQEVFI